jgi:cupin fold WbuC family metalloprotein
MKVSNKSKQLECRDRSVYLASHRFKRLDGNDLETITASARLTDRKRSRICCHDGPNSSPQEMIICLARGTYIRPHRHHKGSESGLSLRGTADAVFFDMGGSIVDVWRMGPEQTGYPFFYRIDEPVFHCLLVRTEEFVFHEVSTGPFLRDDTEFASWSPDEKDIREVGNWMLALQRAVDEFGVSPP